MLLLLLLLLLLPLELLPAAGAGMAASELPAVIIAATAVARVSPRATESAVSMMRSATASEPPVREMTKMRSCDIPRCAARRNLMSRANTAPGESRPAMSTTPGPPWPASELLAPPPTRASTSPASVRM